MRAAFDYVCCIGTIGVYGGVPGDRQREDEGELTDRAHHLAQPAASQRGRTYWDESGDRVVDQLVGRNSLHTNTISEVVMRAVIELSHTIG